MRAQRCGAGSGGGPGRWRAGFTLVEIMIVVAVLGLLAAIALPSFMRARRNTQIGRFVNDLRVAEEAFCTYCMHEGDYPPDESRGVLPPDMAEYLKRIDWTKPTPVGGVWDWERDSVGISAGVSVVIDPNEELFKDIDRRIDDGFTWSGKFRRLMGTRYTYVIEE